MSSLLTPPARLVDPRGQRFGAGFSAVILVGAIAFNAVPVVALVGLALLVSSAFGTRYWLLGKPWPFIRRALRLGPTELEHEYPPRFAQALGFVALALAVVAFVVGGGAAIVGWVFVAAVIGASDAAGRDRHLRRLPPVLPALVRPERVRAPDHRPQGQRHRHPEHDAPDPALTRPAGRRRGGR